MSATNLLRRLMTKTLRQRPTRPIRVTGVALRFESLEDRTTPAVGATLTGSDLQVTLGTAGDVANLILNGSNIEVHDASSLILAVSAASVTDFDITGSGAGAQTVNLNSTFALTGSINVGLGGNTKWVSDVNFNASQTAGLVDVNATNNVTVRSITTTGAALPGPVTDGSVALIADVDDDGNGTFNLTTNASINTTGSLTPTPTTPGYEVTVHGAGITFSPGSNITAGTGGVAVDSSDSNFVYTAPATNVITNTSGTFQVNSYDPAARVWAADTTVASFTGAYVLFIQRAASLTLSGINTSAGGNHVQVNVGDHGVSAGGNLVIGGAINAGAGAVVLSADNAAITDPAVATVTTTSQVTLTALTTVGTLALPISTAAAQLTSTSASGGIWINNTGNVTVNGNGVVVTGNGDIGFTNTGSIDIASGVGITTGGGNVTVQALGAAADVTAGNTSTPFQVFGGTGTYTLSAGRDILLGNSSGGADTVTHGGAVSFTAGRDLVLDDGSGISSAGGAIGLFSSRDISLSRTTTTGSSLHSANGAITITTGTDGTFTNDSGSGGGVFAGSGPITVGANTVTDMNPITTSGAVAINLTTSSATTGGSVTVGAGTVNAPINGSSVTVTGTANPDTFALAQDSGSAITLNAGNPAPFTTPGDVLSLPSGGGTETPSGVGTGTITGAPGLPTVTYTSIESVVGATPPITLAISFTALGTPVRLVRSGTDLDVYAGAALVSVNDYATVGSITVTGSAAADELFVDNSGGLISRTITYTGSGAANGDALFVGGDAGAGVSAIYATSSAGTANSGSLSYTDGTNTETINFTGLAPVESLTPVASLTINDGSNSTTENIVTGPTSTGTDPLLGTTATTYQVNFANPTAESFNWRNATTVTVNGSAGADTVTVNLPTRVDSTAGAFALATLNVNPGGGSDEVDVLATPAGVTTAVDTGAGNPDRTVIGGTFAGFNTGSGTLANVLGAVTVTDAGGVGQLYVDDSGAAAGVTATVTATTLAVGATPTITYDSTMDTVQLALTAFGDTVNVTGTQSGAASSNTTVTTIFTNTGADSVNIGNAGLTSGILGALNLSTAGPTHVTVDDSADATGQAVTISDTQLSGLTPAPINYTLTAGSQLDVAGGTGSDTFAVTPSATVPIGVTGGAPTPPASPGDRLNIDTTGTTGTTLSAASGASGFSGTWTFGNRAAVTFAQIESLSPAAFIRGTVFDDANRNGVQDAGEAGVGGATVTLDLGADGTVDRTATTDASGNYSFLVQAGVTVRVREVVPAGLVQTTANPNDFVVQDGVNVTADFGTAAPAPAVTRSVSGAFGPSGEVIAVVDSTGLLTQYDAAGAHALIGGVRSASVAFSPQGEVLLVTFTDGSLVQYGAAGTFVLAGGGVRGASVAFAPQGEVVLVTFADGSLVQYGALGTAALAGGVTGASVAFGTIGGVLVVTYSDGSLVQYGAAGTSVLSGGGVQSASVASEPSGEVLFVLSGDGSLVRYDALGAHALGIVA